MTSKYQIELYQKLSKIHNLYNNQKYNILTEEFLSYDILDQNNLFLILSQYGHLNLAKYLYHIKDNKINLYYMNFEILETIIILIYRNNYSVNNFNYEIINFAKLIINNHIKNENKKYLYEDKFIKLLYTCFCFTNNNYYKLVKLIINSDVIDKYKICEIILFLYHDKVKNDLIIYNKSKSNFRDNNYEFNKKLIDNQIRSIGLIPDLKLNKRLISVSYDILLNLVNSDIKLKYYYLKKCIELKINIDNIKYQELLIPYNNLESDNLNYQLEQININSLYLYSILNFNYEIYVKLSELDEIYINKKNKEIYKLLYKLLYRFSINDYSLNNLTDILKIKYNFNIRTPYTLSLANNINIIDDKTNNIEFNTNDYYNINNILNYGLYKNYYKVNDINIIDIKLFYILLKYNSIQIALLYFENNKNKLLENIKADSNKLFSFYIELFVNLNIGHINIKGINDSRTILEMKKQNNIIFYDLIKDKHPLLYNNDLLIIKSEMLKYFINNIDNQKNLLDNLNHHEISMFVFQNLNYYKNIKILFDTLLNEYDNNIEINKYVYQSMLIYYHIIIKHSTNDKNSILNIEDVININNNCLENNITFDDNIYNIFIFILLYFKDKYNSYLYKFLYRITNNDNKDLIFNFVFNKYNDLITNINYKFHYSMIYNLYNYYKYFNINIKNREFLYKFIRIIGNICLDSIYKTTELNDNLNIYSLEINSFINIEDEELTSIADLIYKIGDNLLSDNNHLLNIFDEKYNPLFIEMCKMENILIAKLLAKHFINYQLEINANNIISYKIKNYNIYSIIFKCIKENRIHKLENMLTINVIEKENITCAICYENFDYCVKVCSNENNDHYYCDYCIEKINKCCICKENTIEDDVKKICIIKKK